MYMRRVGGRKVTRLTPGDLMRCPQGLGELQGRPKVRQESAEVIRGGEEPPKGFAMQEEPVRNSRRSKEEQSDG